MQAILEKATECEVTQIAAVISGPYQRWQVVHAKQVVPDVLAGDLLVGAVAQLVMDTDHLKVFIHT